MDTVSHTRGRHREAVTLMAAGTREGVAAVVAVGTPIAGG
jgi:hypothetical protein